MSGESEKLLGLEPPEGGGGTRAPRPPRALWVARLAVPVAVLLGLLLLPRGDGMESLGAGLGMVLLVAVGAGVAVIAVVIGWIRGEGSGRSYAVTLAIPAGFFAALWIVHALVALTGPLLIYPLNIQQAWLDESREQLVLRTAQGSYGGDGYLVIDLHRDLEAKKGAPGWREVRHEALPADLVAGARELPYQLYSLAPPKTAIPEVQEAYAREHPYLLSGGDEDWVDERKTSGRIWSCLQLRTPQPLGGHENPRRICLEHETGHRRG